MTLFNNEDDNTRETLEDVSNPLEHLVGEGKKFKTAEDLAKGKLESDRFIEQILREKRELEEVAEQLRTELKTRSTVEDAMNRLMTNTNQNSQDTSAAARQGADANGQEKNTLTPEDVKKILNEEREKLVRQANVDKVMTTLKEKWGNTYSTELTQMAPELGGKEFLAQLAETNPVGFLKLVEANRKTNNQSNQNNLFSPPQSQHRSNISEAAKGNLKGHKYYQNIRRTQPKEWQKNIARYEREMQEQMAKLGQDYFNH